MDEQMLGVAYQDAAALLTAAAAGDPLLGPLAAETVDRVPEHRLLVGGLLLDRLVAWGDPEASPHPQIGRAAIDLRDGHAAPVNAYLKANLLDSGTTQAAAFLAKAAHAVAVTAPHLEHHLREWAHSAALDPMTTLFTRRT